jgi:hypothetical protein
VNETLTRIIQLVRQDEVRISEHGYEELAADGIFARDLIEGLSSAIVVEDYPNYPKGPCVPVLQRDRDRRAVHVVWGIPKGAASPAVLMTACRPSPERWSEDFTRRRK